jgi:putative flippase GtrA
VRELASFAAIGLVCTVLFLVIYDLARPALAPLAANVVALSSTAGLNFLANRSLTFRGREGRLLTQAAQYFAFYLLALAISSLVLFSFLQVWNDPPHHIELMAALAASGIATLLRYLAMTLWVFPQRTSQDS